MLYVVYRLNYLYRFIQLVEYKFLQLQFSLELSISSFRFSMLSYMRVNEPVVPLNRVIGEAYQYLTTFHCGQPIPTGPTERRNIKWKPPLSRLYKTNFNGAMFEESSEARTSVVIRKYKGEVKASLLEKI